MVKDDERTPSKRKSEERRAASEEHDAQFFKDRKIRDERNLELTLKLRAQRLAHEATSPKKVSAPKPVPKSSKRRKETPVDD